MGFEVLEARAELALPDPEAQLLEVLVRHRESTLEVLVAEFLRTARALFVEPYLSRPCDPQLGLILGSNFRVHQTRLAQVFVRFLRERALEIGYDRDPETVVLVLASTLVGAFEAVLQGNAESAGIDQVQTELFRLVMGYLRA